jgi:hypothetical protein
MEPRLFLLNTINLRTYKLIKLEPKPKCVKGVSKANSYFIRCGYL